MNRQEANEALALLRKVVSQARDDTTLQNWGVIWMVHGITNGGGFFVTHALMAGGADTAWPYAMLWSVIVTFNISSILLLRTRSAGARSFVETQLWTIWMTFIACVILTGLVNHITGFQVFTLGPVLGVLSAFAFAMMGGVIAKRWFALAAVFAVASLIMAAFPDWQFVILGSIWGFAQFGAGLILHRARRQRLLLEDNAARLV